MTRVLKKYKTLGEIIMNHSNDYGFSVFEAAKKHPRKLSSLSVIIPYYGERDVIKSTLRHLYNGFENIGRQYPNWKYEVLMIDDGSKVPLRSILKNERFENLEIFRNRRNNGRVYSRNKGLKEAEHELCLFMDADIAIDNSLILNHLKIQSFSRHKKKKVITVGFFEFTDIKNKTLRRKVIKPSDIKLNDFRVSCIYEKTWYGSESDKKFIGQKFNILRQSNYFKNWPKNGFLGPWMITNMVLGGFFMVRTRDARKVGCFEKSFAGYGFTETSLPTKLIAALNYFVVPVPLAGGLHIESKSSTLTRIEKDSLFRKKHFKYFNEYLKLTLKQSIK